MTRYLFIICSLLLTGIANAQANNSVTNVHKFFEFKVDSIEQKMTINKRGTSTSYFLHYTVTNISKDTLNYITNSCFYYNHYSLKVGGQEFDLNAAGGCYMNTHDWHMLSPGEKFNETESITATNLSLLKTGSWYVTLIIPLLKQKVGYIVDGRDFVENKQYLIYEGKTKIVETIVDNRKRPQ